MDYQLILLICAEGRQESHYHASILKDIGSIGLRTVSVTDAKAIAFLKQATASRQEPGVIIIGPNVPNPVGIARAIRAVWPIGQMLFAPAPEHAVKLRQELRHAPMIGANWSLLELGDSGISRQLQRAVQSSQQRVRLRTTLDRANIKLGEPKAVDSLDYRRLVLSEHYLASLLQQSQDAIVSLDRHNTVLYWSIGAENLFRQTADAMHGMPVAKLPFWSSVLDSYLEQILSGSQSVSVEIQCRLLENEVDLEIFFSRVHDDAGNFIGTSLSLRDVSTRNRMLEVERNARREAERLSRMKDEFLAMLSHELRTPLSAVIGRAQLLQMQHRNDAELVSALNVIERNAQLQAKLIEDLLDVSSVITGKLHLEMQPITIGKLAESAIESIRPTAQAKQIRLILTSYAPSSLVLGDPYRLQQVLYNLLANGVKFTPEGGCVEVCLRQEESTTEISVRDDGIGISPAFLPMVFERFGQEDASITRRHGGLGLGLSIAKQLVEMHGGSIRADSPGRNLGATFTITLPAYHSDETTSGIALQANQEPALSGRLLLNDCRILVVEDIADTRQLIVDVLRNYGAQVIAVDSGAAALLALESDIPDVLVSDIGMPDMDGYALIKRIRAIGISADRLPALALTAFAGSADRAKALMSGFQSHVAKPLIVTELVNVIARLHMDMQSE